MEKNNNSTFESDFDEDNFASDNRVYGTTREAFDRRSLIDQKNLQETFVRDGITWDTYGECKICGNECRRRCVKCPWVFYCTREHQLEDWPEHKKNCNCIEWGEDGLARAGIDLVEGVVILERSTILVAPRYYTDLEMSKLTSEDYEQSDGRFRPCFGCHTLIPAYFNRTLVCRSCKFPIHNAGCEVSPWHIAECKIFKSLRIQNWYDEVGRREDIMIHIAILRGVLLKQTNSSVWTQIMSMESDSPYLISEELKLSILYFIFELCKVEGVEIEEVVKLLKIFMKQRLNCTLPCSISKRLVSVLCSGVIPFTLVSDQNANVHGGIYDYRMRMVFRTVKPVRKGELLTIGRGT